MPRDSNFASSSTTDSLRESREQARATAMITAFPGWDGRTGWGDWPTQPRFHVRRGRQLLPSPWRGTPKGDLSFIPDPRHSYNLPLFFVVSVHSWREADIEQIEKGRHPQTWCPSDLQRDQLKNHVPKVTIIRVRDRRYRRRPYDRLWFQASFAYRPETRLAHRRQNRGVWPTSASQLLMKKSTSSPPDPTAEAQQIKKDFIDA